jgi:hypothetical protein
MDDSRRMLEVMVVGSEEMLDGGRGVAVPVRGVKVETLELLCILGNLLEQAGGRGVVVHVKVERHSCGGKAFVLLVVGELAGVQCVAYMCRKGVGRRSKKSSCMATFTVLAAY